MEDDEEDEEEALLSRCVAKEEEEEDDEEEGGLVCGSCGPGRRCRCIAAPEGGPGSPATGPGRAPEDAARSGGGGEVEWEVVSDKDGVDVTFPEALTDRALAAFCAP